MNKLLAVLLAAMCTLTVTPVAHAPATKIPSDYYNRPCRKPAHLTFYDWIATLPMPPYEENAFDCSQRSAYVEWLSENCSHRATIAGKAESGWGHIWVLIDIGGVPFAYETTWPLDEGDSGRWRLERDQWFHYDPDTEWESIYDAPQDPSRFEGEYGWWLTYPELWEVK